MRASYRQSAGRPAPPEGENAHEEEEHEVSHLTIQEVIRLTARFESGWFRSPRTLDEDLARFAAAHRLSAEEVRQVRSVMEAMSEDGGADPDARGKLLPAHGLPDSHD